MLDGVEELPPEVAASLTRNVGEHGCISLSGLRTLTPEAARAVGGCKNILSRNFPWLRSLSPEAARALAGYRGNLTIHCPGGLITPKLFGLMTEAGIKPGWAVKPGEGRDGIKFLLVGLETLTPEDVASLAAANPFNPSLGGIVRLEPETARAIVAQLPRNAMYFPDLLDVPPEFAGASHSNKELQIGYDPETPKRLVQTAETLTNEVARLFVRLAESGHPTVLGGITSIESLDAGQLAAILATSKAGLALRNLRRISPKTLTALLEKEDVEIPAIETLELIEEPDGSPTEDFVVPEGFTARQRLRQRDRTTTGVEWGTP